MDGRIVEVATIHHRRLNAAPRFSAELRDRVGRMVDRAHFHPHDVRD
jgi:hypothetical protein